MAKKPKPTETPKNPTESELLAKAILEPGVALVMTFSTMLSGAKSGPRMIVGLERWISSTA